MDDWSKTRGFLYYHRHPFLPLTTGEIRFRVTESSDPTCFQNGTDLTRSDGALPWSLPVIRLHNYHAPIIKLLEPDIPEAILNLKTPFRKICLTFLEQPFVMRLEAACAITTVDSQLCIRKAFMPVLLPVPGHELQSTFKGKLLVRFEHAPLSEHENDTSIVVRVLQVLEPPEPLVADARLFHPIPEPGTLLKYRAFGQTRNRTFNHQLLTLLPCMTGSTPTVSTPITKPRHKLPDIQKRRTIGTLDPNRLKSCDYMDISGKASVQLKRPNSRLECKIWYNNHATKSYFPSNTQGFLYLWLKPGLPVLSAQIRFRLTSSDDPTQFEKGTDLFKDGQPWNINVLLLRRFSVLVEQLYNDGHVELIQALSRLSRTSSHRIPLCYMEQPFIYDMSSISLSLSCLLPNGIINSILYHLSTDKSRSEAPYVGRLVLRFERSTLPQHKNGNFVVLRVLKILDAIKPVNPHAKIDLPVPLVGELLVSISGRVRSFNLDKAKLIQGLRALPSLPDDEPDL
ncbi:hypothetical protein C0993_008848, partial [Termitomyces sp. T159_Od127]